MAPAVKEYDVTLDSRKRVTLRRPASTHYHVVERADGSVELQPQYLVDARLSVRTLGMMDEAMARMARGDVSGPIDPLEGLEGAPDRVATSTRRAKR